MNKDRYKIGVLKGDGIGPEIMTSAIDVLTLVGNKFNINFDYSYGEIGGSAYDIYKNPFPDETKKIIDNCDAILLGAVGGNKWDNVEPELRPEKGLLSLRKYMQVYSNIRPITVIEGLEDASPIKNGIMKDVDFVIVRELTGGIYFGDRKTATKNNIRFAYDKEEYNEIEIKRISKIAFDIAMKRNKKLLSVDKSNVLDSSKLWRTVVEEMKSDYPQVEVSHMYVDNAAMQIIKNPSQFDVLLTNNIFGDILSDEASVITGSIGLLPSASIGNFKGLYEPIHGSAPDIANKNMANPVGMILSIALMLKYSFSLHEIANFIETAVETVLKKGIGTIDLNLEKTVTTTEWIEELKRVINNK